MDVEAPQTGPDEPGSPPPRERPWTRWLPSALLLAAALAALSGTALWLLERPANDAVEIFLPTPTPRLPPVVHVAGAVVSPGVYTLADGARVADAIAAAGGPIAGAVIDSLNLSALAVDGTRIDVPDGASTAAQPGGSAPQVQAGPEASGLVDLNRAGAAELETLPGIGTVRARAIVDWRTSNGPFVSRDSLGQVPGIGPETVSALRGLVTPE